MNDPGYRVLSGLFGGAELARLAEAAEAVQREVLAKAASGRTSVEVWPDGHRLESVDGTKLHWEPEAPGTIRSLAPVSHLHPAFEALWTDARLTEPMADLLGVAEPGPFVSKLNFKRAGVGSEFAWHQDFPFWYCCAGPRAHDIATALIYLDDAGAGNGALSVIPGSHLDGPAPRDLREPTGLLVDASKVDESRERVLELPAGSVLMFPGTLVHRSAPNRGDRDRRTLLFCFQPAGRPQLAELPYRPELLADLP
ncbi:phytanoyl-CoA dioxygenase family protein [Amycolatopsis sp. 195334CR]|uniref:phytanoyl-CoA dioxygenase family protein n=1 Tax=Amycolatopsis sp. 195334CR TaxID=2814588 RepID=UPI001A906AD9|nr:phytanoyl-CoA dioxygenase family protein [Amycolatopsis sp. 195334CR]MBN6041680.1 phytanoyl-CoA dioxygenase family protein [Amycolatopsis sp. 195334CR]